TDDPLNYDKAIAEYRTNPALNSSAVRIYGSTSFFNGTLIVNSANAGTSTVGRLWTLAHFMSNALPSQAPAADQTTTAAMGSQGAISTISANGTSNGVIWNIRPGTGDNDLMAYSASSYTTAIFDSNTNSARDSLGTATKFSVPTVENGLVYVGNSSTSSL